MKGVRDIYNGEVANLRSCGYTLQEIGDKCGVTRERIRQILHRFYPDNLYPDVFMTHEISIKLGISDGRVLSLCKRMNISPIKTPHHSRWDQYVLPLLSYTISHIFCRVCGKPVEPPRTIYCSAECNQIYGDSRYSRSAEYREKQKICHKRWRENHHERVRELNRKAGKAYYSRLRAKHRYVIVGKCEIPMGVIVKNVGEHINGKIPVEWNGEKYVISSFCLKKLDVHSNENG